MRYPKVLAAASATAVIALAGCGSTAHPAPAVTVTRTATATVTVTAPAPSVTRTVIAHVTQTATVAPPALTVAKYSGTGDWNSPPFTLSGNPLSVTYSYSGNQGSNFIADVQNSGDDQSIANLIGSSGGTTTALYPSGGDAYHLSVTATGSWQFTITQSAS